MSHQFKNMVACSLLLVFAHAAIANPETFTFNDLVLACKQGNHTKVKGLLMAGMNPNAYYGVYELPLLEAVKYGFSGDIETVLELLNYGADINARDYRNDTALKWAAYKGHYHLVSILLDRGADRHARDIEGYTALLDAVRMGHTLIVKLLLQHGANPLDMDNYGRSAYTIARQHGYHDIAALLHSYAPFSLPAPELCCSFSFEIR